MITTATNLAHPIAPGTLCRLPDGTIVRVHRDIAIGKRWSGDYRVRVEGQATWRIGVSRDQLEPLTPDEARAYLAAWNSRHGADS